MQCLPRYTLHVSKRALAWGSGSIPWRIFIWQSFCMQLSKREMHPHIVHLPFTEVGDMRNTSMYLFS
jgi:hypothetical protein